MMSADMVFMYGTTPPDSPSHGAATHGALQAAIAFLRRGIRADGTYEGVDEWETPEHQWRTLASWAARKRLIVPTEIAPAKTGGREHDVFHPEGGPRWIKFTKPSSAGYAVAVAGDALIMRPATPLEYLERWRIGNRYFGDDAEFLGISEAHQGRRLVISQRDIVGESATWEEVENAFTTILPMRRLHTPEALGGYESRAYVFGRIAVFDVRPVNCVRTSRGVVVPIDVIPQVFNRWDASVLARLSSNCTTVECRVGLTRLHPRSS